MDPSVSPNEFFATHLYVPKSFTSIDRIVSFIITLYAFSTVTGSKRSPIKKKKKIKLKETV
jgi:hypothetical protein